MKTLVDTTWQLHAACRGPQSAMFYPPSNHESKSEKDAREAKAKRICSDCSVRFACLDYAVAIKEPHGIWGGYNELERRSLLRKQKAAAAL